MTPERGRLLHGRKVLDGGGDDDYIAVVLLR